MYFYKVYINIIFSFPTAWYRTPPSILGDKPTLRPTVLLYDDRCQNYLTLFHCTLYHM